MHSDVLRSIQSRQLISSTTDHCVFEIRVVTSVSEFPSCRIHGVCNLLQWTLLSSHINHFSQVEGVGYIDGRVDELVGQSPEP